jgi:hypothetical protein
MILKVEIVIKMMEVFVFVVLDCIEIVSEVDIDFENVVALLHKSYFGYFDYSYVCSY